MRTPLATLTLTLALSLAGVASADVQECRVLNGKMTCEMVRTGQRLPVTSQPRQMFLGKVTNVLDHETLQVETEGKTVLVRPVINRRWTISAEELRVVCLGKTVGVYVRQADAQALLADVLLNNTDNLSTVLAQVTRESPAADAARQQQAVQEAREQAAEDTRKADMQARQVAALVEHKSAEQSRREALEMVLTGLKQIPRPADYQARIDFVLSRTLKDPDSRRVTFDATPWGSLVCGTVNARNSFGGYTGGQPFVTYFTAQKEMGHFRIYTEKDVQRAKLTVSGSLDEAIEKVFVEACQL